MKKFPDKYKWDQNSMTNFQTNFNHPAVQNELQSFLYSNIELNEMSINTATTISDIIDKVAKTSFKKKDKKENFWKQKVV